MASNKYLETFLVNNKISLSRFYVSNGNACAWTVYFAVFCENYILTALTTSGVELQKSKL